jgi:hypothetical protein
MTRPYSTPNQQPISIYLHYHQFSELLCRPLIQRAPAATPCSIGQNQFMPEWPSELTIFCFNIFRHLNIGWIPEFEDIFTQS